MNYRCGFLIIVVSLHSYVSGTLQGLDRGTNNNRAINFLRPGMNNMSMEEFARNFVTKDNQSFDLTQYLNTDEFRHSVAGADAPLASLDACGPRYTSVVLKDDDPTVFFWPPCTIALRCGGCCPSEMLECSPIEKDYESVMVMRVRIESPGSTMKFVRMQINVVEHHTKCEPQCKVKETDCDLNIHNYLPQDCRCKCIVGDTDPQRPRCTVKGQRWDEMTCSCVCSITDADCEGFSKFNRTTCRCELRQSVSADIARIQIEALQSQRISTTSTLPPIATFPPFPALPTLPPLSLSAQCSPPFPCLTTMVPRLVNGRCRCISLLRLRRKREEIRRKYQTVRRQR